jgi:adenylate cyclase
VRILLGDSNVADSSSAYLEFDEEGGPRELPIPPDAVFRVGRSEKNNLVLNDDLASRTHAMLQCASDGVYITDCGSSNGTFVNGARISAPQVLRSGDQIKIGHKLLTFRERVVQPARMTEPASDLASTRIVFSQSLITVLVVDIRDFTVLARRVEPGRLAQIAGSFFREAGKLLQERGAWTQKYIGDAVLAIWQHGEELASTAPLSAAIDAQLRLAKVAARLQGQFGLDAPIRIGAGINTGWASVGNVGSIASSDYTALGDVVNLAFRLESATKEIGCDLAVGQGAYEFLANAGAAADLFERCSLTLKGYDEPKTVYATRLAMVPTLLQRLSSKIPAS